MADLTTSLFKLDIQLLQNEIARYRRDPKLLRKPVLFVAGFGFYLYFNIFRHVVDHPDRVLNHWHVMRYVLPAVVAWFAVMIGGWGRMNRLLARWSGGSWSILPVEPRPIAAWLTGSMLLRDSAWLGLGLALSIGFSIVLHFPWWSEFPFLLLGTALLIAAASAAKLFAALLLRLTGRGVLFWPNWLLRMVATLIAAIFIQPLLLFWLSAEYLNQQDSRGPALMVLLALAGVITGLAFLARLVVIRQWPVIAASFELQQTQRNEKSDLPLANLLVRPMRSPVSRFVTLYNLRSGIEMRRWGQPVNVGGRRMYMILIAFVAVAMLQFVVCMTAMQKPDDPFVVAVGGLWSLMFMMSATPPIMPVYRLLRMLPVTFGEWLWAVAALPFAFSSVLVIGLSVFAAVADPAMPYQAFIGLWGLFLGGGLLRFFVMSAYPKGGQLMEYLYLALVAVCGLAYFTVSWMLELLLILAVNIFFYRKARHEWNNREEGLRV
jgi:hypothetical protein